MALRALLATELYASVVHLACGVQGLLILGRPWATAVQKPAAETVRSKDMSAHTPLRTCADSCNSAEGACYDATGAAAAMAAWGRSEATAAAGGAAGLGLRQRAVSLQHHKLPPPPGPPSLASSIATTRSAASRYAQELPEPCPDIVTGRALPRTSAQVR